MVSLESTDHLLRGCDDSQRAAIMSEESPLLVIAGAGSGKTRILTRRIAWRVATGVASPSTSLALTFTRKAASELRLRLRELGLPLPVTSGTFHGVALAQLRQRALDRDRPLPVLVESKARILSTILPDLANRRSGRAPLDRRDLIGGVAGEIEWAKARLITPERYSREAQVAGRTPPIDVDAVAENYQAYETERKRRRMYDFDDLLTTLAELIERDPDFAATQRWNFRHLYVDEFQDANAAQLRLLDAWLGGRRDLFCVGDARQSIYGWNGADPSAMENFASRYVGSRVMELSTNYRSTEQVVRFAHSILARSGPPPRVTREEGPLPTITQYASAEEEAIGVADAIRRQIHQGTRVNEIAVLARTNAQLIAIERALSQAGIALRQTGTDHFLSRPEIQRALGNLIDEGDHRRSATQRFKTWLTDLSLNDFHEENDRLTNEESDDLATLLLLAEDYGDLEPLPSPDGFRRYLEQALRNDLLPRSTPAVDLLSFHRAKGLEWKSVFIIGMEEGYIPINQAKTRAQLAEEQRLLYVALSRASSELHCSWCTMRSFGRRSVKRDASPYLTALGEELARLAEAKRVDPTRAKAAFAQGRALLAKGNTVPER